MKKLIRKILLVASIIMMLLMSGFMLVKKYLDRKTQFKKSSENFFYQIESIMDSNSEEFDVAISEIGEVNNSGEPILIKEDGSDEKLVPLFREAAYTKIKKLVGETTPEDFEMMKEKVQKASDLAIAKKDKVIEHIRGER